MNYRPDPDQLVLWDTWMFPDPGGLRMHLFFLANRPGQPWEWIGHAVSSDLVHWEDLPPIQVGRAEDPYDVGVIGTGMVFASPTGGFMMSYTANLDGEQQRISFLHSNDLVNWDKRWPQPCIAAQLPYYQVDAAQAVSNPPAFRDAYIHKVGDHHEALIGAYAAEGPELLRGCIARYRSTDEELRVWQPLVPLIGPGVTMLMEVPEHFQINDKHYLLWSTVCTLGVACDTPARRGCSGTFYAVADSYEGAYAVPADNLLIGAGDYPATLQSYVGRTVVWGGERLLYHHMGLPGPSAAFPKRLSQDTGGRLRLAYWPGIETAHAKETVLPLDRIAVQGENLRAGDWVAIGKSGLRGSTRGGGSLALVPGDLQDIHVRCQATTESGTRFGVSLRDAGRREPGSQGVALQGDVRYGEWQFATPRHSWCSYVKPIETIREAPEIGRTYRIDLIVRDIYFEAYVDGIWKFSRVINDHARRGRIGLYVEGGTARFEQIQAWELEPMVHAARDRECGNTVD